MDKMTLGVIYAIKQPTGESIKQSVINFLSEYTGTEKEYYSDEKVAQIIRDAFIDYLKTADNPAFDVWQYFDAKRMQKNFADVFPEEHKRYVERDDLLDEDTQAIIAALQLSVVKQDGKYVNGFSEEDNR